MKQRIVTRYDRRLKHVVVVLALLASGHAIDFITGAKAGLRVVRGNVESVNVETFFGHARSNRQTYYAKTTITLKNRHRKFFATENGNPGNAVYELKKGDELEIYSMRWYQYLTYSGGSSNMYLVKKDGITIYNGLDKCNRANKLWMIIFAVLAFFFFVIYLDVVKNISLENWFQKKVLKNKDYL